MTKETNTTKTANQGGPQTDRPQTNWRNILTVVFDWQVNSQYIHDMLTATIKAIASIQLHIWVYVDTNKHDIGQLAFSAHLISEVIPVMMREAIGARNCLEYLDWRIIVNHSFHGRTGPL
ncbi:hypothetical protein LIPSTDRAFT_256180 [Lipomyces starkeyi NRRL Y-11557]|uniref:Uncharacterized protein n=1 Tax=Lipomyces starkeyi NRRL Y-11557 TaxID=675824 RepID=A0A1E3Q9Y5_LIPST|nr:hypothetical protein LIPSTDRAFT_256180 [Lipomyces starkeyi NRRL Y-11557]